MFLDQRLHENLETDEIDADNDDIADNSLGNSDTLVNQHPLEPTMDSKLCLAPTEGNTPISLFNDPYAEEMAYPTLFNGMKRQARIHKVPYSVKWIYSPGIDDLRSIDLISFLK